MNAVIERFPVGARAGVALSTVGICVVALLAGLVGIIAIRATVGPLVAETAAFRVVAGNLIQVGFAGFAAVYLHRAADAERFVPVRVPTPRDVGWIAVAAFGVPIVGVAGAAVLSAVGLPEPMPGGGHADVLSNPALWPVAFVGLYLFAAPAEEAVFRGIVQGRLREAFGFAGTVLVSAAVFGLLHFLVGLLTPAVGFDGSLYWGLSALVPGVIWGYAYERTRNLVVTSVAHAMSWTVPFGALLPFV
ncbi:CPBP family intramembrane metalloprotease [Halobaculum sp. WSA2]|uniref:CPBP family intramembrane metalloprotease n=1 Tax=Halobaculum saliterrae TaxID=2073113 RepID=A0A6B0SW94_9EURY|nr:type II CAAX endopeptidase family protein [Halobaculum saliterrae]MXR40941.1 CPBP family intramembrane metalloprotease [Halobaculum saliterrae]